MVEVIDNEFDEIEDEEDENEEEFEEIEDENEEEIKNENIKDVIINNEIKQEIDDKNQNIITKVQEYSDDDNLIPDSTIISARSFDKIEIMEMSSYIRANIPFTILQELFILTDVPISKARIFIAVYRILNTTHNSVSKKTTKKKLYLLLHELKDVYSDIYKILVNLQHALYSFQKRRNLMRLKNVFLNQQKNEKINRMIDIFLVIGEKHELLDLNKITGFDLETEEGRKMYKDTMSQEI